MNFVKNFGVIFCCETCQSKNDEFLLDGYECYCGTCKVSVASTRKSRRGHGGVCLFVKENLSKVLILLKQIAGVLFGQSLTNYFKLDDTLFMCFAYIPIGDSVYFKAHETVLSSN